MLKLESKVISAAHWKPWLYRCYIDDCLLVWLHGLELLLELVEFMNLQHPDIRFTVEHTHQNDDHRVSSLDLDIRVNDGVVQWELFRTVECTCPMTLRFH